MKKPFISLMSGFLLLVAVVMSSLGMAFGASSTAAGSFLVSILCICLFVSLCAIHRPTQRLSNITFIITGVLAVVFIHGMLSFLINATFDFVRFWQSYIFLIIFIMGASSLALLIEDQKLLKFKADFAVKFVFYALCLAGTAGILGYSPFGFSGHKPVLFFSEPSHFALSFLPFLLYMTVLSGLRIKLFLILIGYIIAILIQNMSLVVGITLIAILVFNFRILLFVLLVTVAVISINLSSIDYYSERVNISDESQNLSALVYLSGWERAYLNFKDSFGIGVGFQQFGIVGSRGKTMDNIAMLNGTDLNLLDGSFGASKLIGEFGVLGLAMLSVYFVYFVKSFIWLRKASINGVALGEYDQVFFLSCIVMYCIDLLIRGIGYFSSSGYFFVASLVWLKFRHSASKHRTYRQ